jgi:methyl-accepting chemotaxis protein
MSINAMLKTLCGALCLVIIAFLSNHLWTAWTRMQEAEEYKLKTFAASKLFVTLANMRTDASIARGLLAKDDIVASLPEPLVTAREQEMQAFAQAIEALKDLELPNKEATIAFMTGAYARMQDPHQQSNSAIAQPKASRPADLTKTYGTVTFDIMAQLDSVGGALKKSILFQDAAIDQLLHLHSFTWSLRINSGNALAVVTNNIITRGDIPADAKLVQANTFGKLDSLKDTIKAQLANLGSRPELEKAFAEVENRYFDPAFRTLQVASLDKLMAGQKLDFTRENWDSDVAIRVNTIRDLAVALIGGASTIAETQYRTAAASLTVSLASLIAAIVATLAITLLINLRIIRPIVIMTRSMQRISAGELDTPIPSLDRRDEVGAMAKAVQVFRENALRGIALEQEAETNRQVAEMEKAELQARADAEADERLNRATDALASGLKRLASGDMLCEIHEPFAPQFEALREDFNNSVSQLREVLLAAGQSAGSVTSGTSEISNASDDLSRRTEQQAVSIEQTAAALDEITVNVQLNSERTMEVRGLVTDARGKAAQARQVVSNAVAAMDRIERSAHQINQNIGVIDEIAFQTNLLALNAGVEAARAGEAGKGFAVVAQEVRELAQRSANAAKEIKALIRGSEAAVEEGVKLVNDTGEGLNAISHLVQLVDTLMGAIATASQQQSVGIREVNISINQMDQSTQSNAAMVEEMNAATAGLVREAVNLKELLARFHMETNTGHQMQFLAQPIRRYA